MRGLATGSPGPHPREKLRGLAWEGTPGPHPGVSRPTPGERVSRPRPRECIPACTDADTPQQPATAAGGVHPTGMHSCCCGISMCSIFMPLIKEQSPCPRVLLSQTKPEGLPEGFVQQNPRAEGIVPIITQHM